MFVITSSDGLVPPDRTVGLADLERFASVPIDAAEPRYRAPLLRDLGALAETAPDAEVVLLGSIATDKYVEPLRTAFGDRLRFPADFAGRGDMSRGGLLLRCVEEARELAYVAVGAGPRHGARPERLTPKPGILARAMARRGDDGTTRADLRQNAWPRLKNHWKLRSEGRLSSGKPKSTRSRPTGES